MFSDQQMVTGLAILISAFPQLKRSIACCHWQITVYIAWFESLTHLTTLTFLRAHFQRNRVIRTWRLTFMCFTVMMLGTALLPTGNTSWVIGRKLDHAWFCGNVLAKCYFQKLYESRTGNFIDLNSPQGFNFIVSMLFLCFGYISKALQISINRVPWTRFTSAIPRLLESDFLESRRRGRFMGLLLGAIYATWFAIHLNIQAAFLTCASDLWEVRLRSKALVLTINQFADGNDRFFGFFLL